MEKNVIDWDDMIKNCFNNILKYNTNYNIFFMTTKDFERKQQEMSNEELIELALNEISNLAKTYGRSHKMSIPPMITDTDMILSEVVRRFKDLLSDDK